MLMHTEGHGSLHDCVKVTKLTSNKQNKFSIWAGLSVYLRGVTSTRYLFIYNSDLY